MGYNSEPGQSASGFRLYIDNAEKAKTIIKEDIVIGAKIRYGNEEYEVTKIKGEEIYLETFGGYKKRFTVVVIEDLLKN